MYCREGWPDKSSLKGPYKPYLAVASELCVTNGLLYEAADLLFLQTDILNKIHTGHQGITEC